jgi:hypothetical protein
LAKRLAKLGLVIEMENRPVRWMVSEDDREVLKEIQAPEQGRFSVGETGL